MTRWEAFENHRILAGWSLRDVARRAGTSSGYLSDLRCGKREPSVMVTKRLADAFGCTVQELAK